jgi:excisionase family DNA binding protein
MAPDSLMTVKEIAALLRVSPQTLYKMLELGEIPAVKVGSQWRFDREKIKSWIEGQSSPSSANIKAVK